jgi:hypothetical protein
MKNFEMDHDLHMVKEQPRPLNEGTLIMWRRIAESGKMGRLPEGPPAGDVALAMVIRSNEPIDKIMQRVYSKDALQDHISREGDY